MKLGLMMEGGEEQFVEAVRDAMCRTAQSGVCSYLEFGLYYGQTLKGVIEGTHDLQPLFFGIELPECPSWNVIDELLKDEKSVLIIKGRATEVLATWTHGKLSAVMIDGCHGKPCAMADFLAVEPHVADGGIVMFHDAGDAEQGQQLQPHCNEPINVVAALKELCLWDCSRAGWEFVGMIPTANATAVFKKVKTNQSASDIVA